MKKKEYIIGFILGAILFGTISITYAYTLFASDVEYSSRDDKWNATNVKNALDDLMYMLLKLVHLVFYFILHFIYFWFPN